MKIQSHFLKKLKPCLMALAIAGVSASAVAVTPVTTVSNALVLQADTMNRKADACTDFYEFANGVWLKNNPVPADRSRYSAYEEVNERNLNILRTLAEAAVNKADAKGSEKLVGDFFASGMDEARIEQLGAQPMQPALQKVAAIKDRTQLMQVIGEFHREGISSGFGFVVDQDTKNASRYIAQISQGGLSLPDRDYYLKQDKASKDIRAAYLKHVASMLVLAGDSEAAAADAAKRILALETRLAKVSMDKVALRDPEASYHLSDLAGLQKMAPRTDWKAFFEAAGVKDPGPLNIAHPAFFKGLDQLMQSVPVSDWQLLLRWDVVSSYAPYLSKAFVEQNFAFNGQKLAGTKELSPRWKRVLEVLDHSAGESLGQLYVAQQFGPEAKAGVLDMVNNIKEAMRENIAGLSWMSDVTKQQAYKKLDSIMVKIGYPDVWRDYSGLQIKRDDYAGNVKRASAFEYQRMINRLGKPIDRTEWGMTPQTVNAYYNPSMNEIVFPAGILQAPLYHVQGDLAANYGNTGATIGHELTHAFDDEGRQFDAEGNLKSWWTKSDEKEFVRRAKAIEVQFGEYNPIDKLHINGKLTAGENIADLGGMKIALAALRKALAKNPQPELDGLTAEQRFFVANAQSFRSNIRDEMLRMTLATDPHSPDKYRVLAPLANMPEFSAAFRCEGKRSPLRTEAKRVNIW
ncbi:M13 family metallopeptidase [Undibacterium squillarum]|uniref:Peptidase n=1 Tax=Undibacterium squillarum TaxID=1131567 RepID=A0ABQ2XRN1_9BURK|nr:M13 family metallopeptidase [Undibacterium squillarum]GGX30267.1 peptidase [Undibacterium squillarum]